jgi:hypothetical protein
VLFAFPPTGFSASSLEHVRRARELIGSELWSRVIRIENTSPASVYPREVFALVFELGGILWFYTDADGTQSFSLHANNLAAEKADFGPLLRDIDAGLAHHAVMPEDAAVAASREGESLPNGCFIESYAALRSRAERGEIILHARLLSYYVTRRGQSLGHTVLAYETPRGAFVLDPVRPDRPMRSKRATTDDPLALARRLRPDLAIARARWAPTLTGIEAPLLALAPAGGGSRHERARSAPMP